MRSFLFTYTRALSQKVRQAGFTVLLAALVSSIALSLGTSIYAIARKEVTLSSISRDSQFAFYAADTGAECALYWDIRFGFFASTTPAGVNPACDGVTFLYPPATPPGAFISGAGLVVPPLTNQAYGANGYTVQFEFQPNGYCSTVSVTKKIDATSGALQTLIHADGYSVSCAAITTSARALQRSVELNY